MLFTEPSGDPIIGDHAVLGDHGAVTDPSDLQLLPFVHVDKFEQFRDVGPAQVKFAERGDVNEPDVGPYVCRFALRVAVVVWSNPSPGQKGRSTVGLVPVLEGRSPYWFVDSPGQRSQGHRRERWPPDGRSDIRQRHVAPFGQNGGGVDGFQFALGGTHGHRGVTLHQFDRVKALGGSL